MSQWKNYLRQFTVTPQQRRTPSNLGWIDCQLIRDITFTSITCQYQFTPWWGETLIRFISCPRILSVTFWELAESNPGPLGYKSIALLTEPLTLIIIISRKKCNKSRPNFEELKTIFVQIENIEKYTVRQKGKLLVHNNKWCKFQVPLNAQKQGEIQEYIVNVKPQ